MPTIPLSACNLVDIFKGTSDTHHIMSYGLRFESAYPPCAEQKLSKDAAAAFEAGQWLLKGGSDT